MQHGTSASASLVRQVCGGEARPFLFPFLHSVRAQTSALPCDPRCQLASIQAAMRCSHTHSRSSGTASGSSTITCLRLNPTNLGSSTSSAVSPLERLYRPACIQASIECNELRDNATSAHAPLGASSLRVRSGHAPPRRSGPNCSQAPVRASAYLASSARVRKR